MATKDLHGNLEPWIAFGISEQEFDEFEKSNMERDKRVPKIGSLAPDFEAERLTSDGGRTGEMLRPSSIRARPIGLVMGSYT